MYLTVQGQEDADILQDDLNVFQEWEKAWGMEFNPSMCQVLHMSSPAHIQVSQANQTFLHYAQTGPGLY